MTYQDLAIEALRLPIGERLALLEALSRSVRDELVPPATGSSLARILGIARPPGLAPTDDEVRDDYVAYLEAKYA